MCDGEDSFEAGRDDVQEIRSNRDCEAAGVKLPAVLCKEQTKAWRIFEVGLADVLVMNFKEKVVGRLGDGISNVAGIGKSF